MAKRQSRRAQAYANERLLMALAESMKQPLLQIARRAELANMTGRPKLHMGAIELTADSALQQLDNYLLSLRLHEQQPEFYLEPVSVVGALDGAAHQLDRLAKQNQCSLELHISGTYEPVLANQAALEAALVSLGYAFIESQDKEQSKNQPVVKLAAHRGKQGIVAGIFSDSEGLGTDMFRRAHELYGSARQPLPQFSTGTGAGIFIAESLFDSMSARLLAGAPPETNGFGSYAAPKPSVDFGMSRIVLLEPDSQLGYTYQQGLAFAGHDVQWCRDAQSAVDALSGSTPDLIITELQLAMHNGVEFLYELRSYNDWQKLPVVVLSHIPQLERGVSQTLWHNIGIAAYHYKPLTKLHDLIRSVEAVLTPAGT